VTCRDFATFIMDYLTGELPPDTREPFERHLSRCANCREYLQQYQDTVKAGRMAFDCPDDEVPSSVPEDLIKAILAARER
jgi:anti-sigma factor RsiW